MSDEELNPEPAEETPEEVEEHQNEPAEQQDQVEAHQADDPTPEDLSDPNSEYWQDRATKDGWKPKGGKGKYPKTAREFVNDGRLFSHIEYQSQQINSIRDDMTRKHEADLKLQRMGHESTIQGLEKTRADAIEDADRPAADAAQAQIDTLNQQINEISQPPQPAQPAPASSPSVQAYEQSNPWLADINNSMSPNFQKATVAHQTYNAAIAQGYAPDDALRAMDQVVKQQFPEKNLMRQNAGQVERSGRPAGRSSREPGYNDLSRDVQKQIDIGVNTGMYKTQAEAVKQYNSYSNEAKR